MRRIVPKPAFGIHPMTPTDHAPSTASGLSRWFSEEVKPFEPALRAYRILGDQITEEAVAVVG